MLRRILEGNFVKSKGRQVLKKFKISFGYLFSNRASISSTNSVALKFVVLKSWSRKDQNISVKKAIMNVG